MTKIKPDDLVTAAGLRAKVSDLDRILERIAAVPYVDGAVAVDHGGVRVPLTAEEVVGVVELIRGECVERLAVLGVDVSELHR